MFMVSFVEITDLLMMNCKSVAMFIASRFPLSSYLDCCSANSAKLLKQLARKQFAKKIKSICTDVVESYW